MGGELNGVGGRGRARVRRRWVLGDAVGPGQTLDGASRVQGAAGETRQGRAHGGADGGGFDAHPVGGPQGVLAQARRATGGGHMDGSSAEPYFPGAVERRTRHWGIPTGLGAGQSRPKERARCVGNSSPGRGGKPAGPRRRDGRAWGARRRVLLDVGIKSLFRKTVAKEADTEW